MDHRIADPHGSERHFLAFSGASLVVAGLVYLLFPRAAVGLTGIELPAAPAAIDVRATYGGVQIGLGLFLLWCRTREEAARSGLVLVLAVSACLALARVYGFIADGGPGWFNTVGVTVEAGFAAVAAILLGRRVRVGSSAVSTP